MAKIPQNSGQNSPKIGAKIPPAGVPNFVSKLHRKSHFLVGPLGPPKFGPPGSGTPKIYIKHKKRPFLGVQKKAPPFRGPKIRPAGRARRAPAGTARPAARHFTPRIYIPPLINSCPQDRRRHQAEANKRRPGSAYTYARCRPK